MPSPYEPHDDRFEVRDEIDTDKFVLRRYIDRMEPPGRREAWQVNERTPAGEKLVVRGAGHDREAIADVLRRLLQGPEPREGERRGETPGPRRPARPRDGSGPGRDGQSCFAAGRVVEYLEREERATLR